MERAHSPSQPVLISSGSAGSAEHRLARGWRRASLLTRVLVLNSLVLTVAGIGLMVTPVTVSDPVALQEAAVLVAGLAALGVLNLLLLRRAFAPLDRLADVMARVDYLRPGLRIPVYGDDAEVVALTGAFNEMLDRLEAEQEDSLRRSTAAQEEERRRVSQELHDEVGQSLTALKLLLATAAKSPERREENLADARALAETTIEEVRTIAQRLRPEALEELGLDEAIASLASRTGAYGRLRVRCRIGKDLPELPHETQLAIYRIAQEALTNVLRHADAMSAAVSLDREAGAARLVVADDGRGLNGAAPGGGIKGMSERALMVGGRLELSDRAGGGTELSFTVPLPGQGSNRQRKSR